MPDIQHDLIAEQLAEIHSIIVEREGEEVQDQFELDGYIICVNIEGSAYEDSATPDKTGLFTLIQIEKGPMGMEQLLACALEEYDLVDENVESEHFIITGEAENLSELLDDVREKVYRHWHWLDMPNLIGGDEDLIEDEDDFDLE